MKVELEIADKVWGSFCLMCERNGWKVGEMTTQILWGVVMMQDPAIQEGLKKAVEDVSESTAFNLKWDRMKDDFLE